MARVFSGMLGYASLRLADILSFSDVLINDSDEASFITVLVPANGSLHGMPILNGDIDELCELRHLLAKVI